MSEANFDLGFDWEEEEVKTSRFGSTNEEEQDKLMSDRHKDNTQRATKNSIKILMDYLAEKNLPQLETVTDEELPKILLDFYSNLKKVDGTDYKLQTLKCIRAGINRHMKEKRGIDIIADTHFTKTNEMFRAVSTRARKLGLGSTKSTPPIEEQDLIKCQEYFYHDIMNNPDPRKLQRNVLFNIIYYFCRRGRQNLHAFMKDTFAIDQDADGKRFVFQAVDEEDKNHGIQETTPANDGRMYEHPDSPLCPVALFDLYVSKLHKDLPFFWQRPKKGRLHYNDPIWFDRARVGHEPLENFMADLSAEAQLSKRYTNHSIRSTVVGILDELFEGRHVIGLSGHKSENTIKQYARRLAPKKKREMCEALQQNTIVPAKVPRFNFKPTKTTTPSATVSKPPEETHPQQIQEENEENLQQLDLQPLEEPANDDALIKLLESLEASNEINPPAPQALALQEQNNTMNINNVSNVQNVMQNASKPQVPTMYFGGNSTVTINYNFAPPK